MSSRLGNNPLDMINKVNLHFDDEESNVIKKEKIIKRYGRMIHLKKELIDQIDFDDRQYINRIYIDDKELELIELKDSIESIGLLNIIYLQDKNNGKFRVVSGLRRLTACKSLFKEEKDVRGKDRVVVFESNTPEEYLDKISIDENIKRKNLTILEQSFKFNKEASKKNKKIEEILQEYEISKKNFYRIKNAIKYPQSLKNIIEFIGVDKAEIINKILEIKNVKDIDKLIIELKDKKRDELREILSSLKKNILKPKVELEIKNIGLSLKIKKKTSSELNIFFEKIKKMIENDDYSFMEKI